MEFKYMISAIEAHESTNHRYDGKPYFVHLSMVVSYAKKYINCLPDQCHEDVIAACWLHDTIEDCRMTYNDIKSLAGETVAEIVYAVSNDKGKSRNERAGKKYYEGIRNTPWAKFVKLCDRLANVLYSKETGSRMLTVYQSEHDHFVKNLFPNYSNVHPYRPLIVELDELLEYVRA